MKKKILTNKPQPGDVIYVWRKLYMHFGVFIGNDGNLKDQVIHFSHKGEETFFSENDIIQTSLSDFLKGGKLKIQNPNIFGWEPFPTEKIIMRAKQNCGKKKGSYRPIYNNCEHFANDCRYGKHYSFQQMLFVYSKNILALGLLAIIIFRHINSKKKWKS